MTNLNIEYLCSVTLIILGEDLEPDVVSRLLGLSPSQLWRKGEKKHYVRADGARREFESFHEWGGWKLFIHPEKKHSTIEEQIEYWIKLLETKKKITVISKRMWI